MGKTKQASVRFDPEKLELVKRREKLQTPQKVVDFLMDAYYWQNKLVIAPQLQALGQNLSYVTPQVPKTPFEEYEKEIREAGSADELERMGRHLEKDSRINGPDKLKLHSLAKLKFQVFI